MTTLTIERPKLITKGFKRGVKHSPNAKRYAEKKIEKISKGEKIVKGEIALAVGYSEGLAKQPSRIESQQAYKEAMATYESKLVALRDKTLQALASKDLPNEKTYDLTGLLKVTDHSTALAQGKSTENIATKSQVIVFGSEDWLSLQMEKRGNTEVSNK